MNWRRRRLTSHQVVVDLIANTATRTGPKVRAHLDDGYCPTCVKVTDKELATIAITRHTFHGDWSYTLEPTAAA